MKKYKIILALCLCTVLSVGITACDNSNKNSKVNQEVPTYSNLAGEDSVGEVKPLLEAYLDKGNVEEYLKQVKEYNDIVGATGLKGYFSQFNKPQYDVDKISTLWKEKKGDFIGTNCRINSYILLNKNIEIPELKVDDELLFLDNDAIAKGKLFNEEDKNKFQILFSRVKTEATQDIKIHANNMEKYFENFKFNDNARMLSVVIHDNLDGDYLFVGHVGVLVPDKDGFLFVEKLSFEEPYQAIKFSTKEQCYKYLSTKYENYTGDGLAKPFIMDNNKMVVVK